MCPVMVPGAPFPTFPTNNFPASVNITAQDIASTTTVGANGQSLVTGVPTAGSAAAFTFAIPANTVRVQVTGTWTGGVVVETSGDGGTTWIQLNVVQPAILSLGLTTITANFVGTVNTAGTTAIRVRATTIWTGTATVLIVENAGDSIIINSVGLTDQVNGTVGVAPANANAQAAQPALVTTPSPNGQQKTLETDINGISRASAPPILERIAEVIEALLQVEQDRGTRSSVMLVDGDKANVTVRQARQVAQLSDSTLITQVSPLQTPIPVQSAPQGAVNYCYTGYISASTSLQLLAQAYNEVFVNCAGPSIVSASANDSFAGTGTQQVLIVYFDQNLAGPYTTIVRMNGTTPVNLAGTIPAPICYIEAMYSVVAGSGQKNAGNIVFYSGTGATGTQVAQMDQGDGQTYFGRHYVQPGITTYLTGFSLNMTIIAGCLGYINVSSFPLSANSPLLGATGYFGWNTGGSTNFPTPIPIKGPARIVMSGQASTSSGILYGTMQFYDLPNGVIPGPPSPPIIAVQSYPSQIQFQP